MSVTSETGSALTVRALLPLAAVSVFVGLSAAVTMPFLALFLTTQLGVGPVGLGAFLLISPLAGLVVSAVLGRVSDRVPVRRNLLVVGAGAGALGCVVFALVREYWVLLAVAVTLLAAASSVLAQMFAYARQAVERSGAARAPVVITGLRTLISLAWVGGPPLGAFLVANTGYLGLYLVSAGIFAAVAGLAARLPELGRVAPRPRAEQARGSARPRLVLAVLTFAALQGAVSLGAKAVPLFLTVDLGGSEADVGLVLGLCAALEIPLMLWFGVLAMRLEQRRIVLVGAAVALLYHGVMAGAETVWQVALAQALNAVVISAVMGVGISYFQALAPDRPGFITTLYSNTLTIAGMLAGPLLGLAQQLGYRSAYLMSMALAALGVVLLVMAGIIGRRASVAPGGEPDNERSEEMTAVSEKAILAGGCFWGMQDLFRRHPGVLSTRVGYTGGEVPNATYRNHGNHAEAIEIVYDPAQLSYRQILEFFFQIHDPSTRNRQGNDIGASYRSAIFYTDEEQKRIAEQTIADVDASGKWPGKVVTEVSQAGDFWEAEPEHQDYLERYPNGYTCHYVRPEWQLGER